MGRPSRPFGPRNRLLDGLHPQIPETEPLDEKEGVTRQSCAPWPSTTSTPARCSGGYQRFEAGAQALLRSLRGDLHLGASAIMATCAIGTDLSSHEVGFHRVYRVRVREARIPICLLRFVASSPNDVGWISTWVKSDGADLSRT